MRQKRFLVPAALGLLVMLGWSARLGEAGSGVKINVKLDTPIVLLGEAFEADLDALNVPSPGLGVWTVDVTYDPDLVTVVDCDAQQSTSCGVFQTNVRFSGFTFDGLTGDVDLGTITFSGDAEGVMPLGVVVFGLSDTDSNDLTAGMTVNETSVTITSDGATPIPTSTPGETGEITVFVWDRSQSPTEGIPDWPVNVFEGEGCQGQPIASNTTSASGGVAFFSLPPGSYSVSQKPRAGWENMSPFCQDATVEVDSNTIVLFFNTVIPDGDLNKDGTTNSLDALLVLQSIAGLIDDVPNPKRADVNQDGAVNPVDAQLILQFDGGLLEALPVGG